jgi:hypothetical protein
LPLKAKVTDESRFFNEAATVRAVRKKTLLPRPAAKVRRPQLEEQAEEEEQDRVPTH